MLKLANGLPPPRNLDSRTESGTRHLVLIPGGRQANLTRKTNLLFDDWTGWRSLQVKELKTTMTSAPSHHRPRGIDYDLPTCGETKCSGHGFCVIPPGGGAGIACECDLGYQGESCQLTFNGSLSLPLTLGVVAVLIGLVTLAYIVAKLRQKQRQRKREKSMAKQVLCEAGPSP